MRPTPSARTGVKAAVVSAGAVLLLSSGVAFAATGHAPWQAAEALGRRAHRGHLGHVVRRRYADHRPRHARLPRPVPRLPVRQQGRSRSGAPEPGVRRAGDRGRRSRRRGRVLRDRVTRRRLRRIPRTPSTPRAPRTRPTVRRGRPDASPTHPAHPTHPTHPDAPRRTRRTPRTLRIHTPRRADPTQPRAPDASPAPHPQLTRSASLAGRHQPPVAGCGRPGLGPRVVRYRGSPGAPRRATDGGRSSVWAFSAEPWQDLHVRERRGAPGPHLVARACAGAAGAGRGRRTRRRREDDLRRRPADGTGAAVVRVARRLPPPAATGTPRPHRGDGGARLRPRAVRRELLDPWRAAQARRTAGAGMTSRPTPTR